MSNNSNVNNFIMETFNYIAKENSETPEEEDVEEEPEVEVEEENEEDRENDVVEMLMKKKYEGMKQEEEVEKKPDFGKRKNKKSSSKKRERQRRSLLSYLEAVEYGRHHGNCWAVFFECPISFFDLLRSPLDSFYDS